MDRPIVYPNALVTDTDTLTLAKAAEVGLGFAMQAVMGTSTVVDGLSCAPGSGLAVSVGAGSIYALLEADPTAYGSLGIDTGLIVKQGLSRAVTTLSTPAPSTAGQSIDYLIEAQYQDADSGPELLAYYDSANPSVPFTGPGGDGQAQNTLRQGLCVLQVKAGTAAATGSQTAPAADTGWVGLWVVSVANGQSAIVSGDIAEAAGAPFLATKLPQALSTLGGTVTGALAVDGTLNAAGGLSAASGTVSGNLTVDGAIEGGSLNVTGEASLSGGLSVTGTVSLPAGSLALDELPQAPPETVLANLTGATAYPATYTMAQLLSALGVVIPTYAQFRNQQTSGTASGETLTISAWTQRALNTTVENGISGASLSANQITLPAGTYNVSASALCQAGANVSALNHKLRLRDITDGTTLISGVNNAYAGGSNVAVVIASLQGQFTLAASKVVELDSFTDSGGTGGPAVSSGEAEVYVDLIFTKIA